MRYNTFQEAYCHDLADMMEIVEKKALVPDLDLNATISRDEDEPEKWLGEVRFNEDGEIAFWAEDYKSKYDLHADFTQIGIPLADIHEV